MKIKKSLKIVLIIIPLGLVVLIIALGLSLGTIIKEGIETVGSKLAKAPITVEGVSFSFLSGKAEIRGMVIGNPAGFKTDSAFSLGRTRVVVQPSSLLSDTIVIREILVEAPEITYELGLQGSNIGALLKNIEEIAGTGGDEPDAKEEEAKEEDTGEGKKVQIDLFRVADGKIHLSTTVLGGNAVPVPLPTVELTDIGKGSGGADLVEVVHSVFGEVTGSITNVVKSVGDQVGKLKDTALESTKAVKDSAAGAVKGIKGLFGGKKD